MIAWAATVMTGRTAEHQADPPHLDWNIVTNFTCASQLGLAFNLVVWEHTATMSLLKESGAPNGALRLLGRVARTMAQPSIGGKLYNNVHHTPLIYS